MARPHIVDELILERAPRLAASPVWPVARPVLYGLLGYGKAVRMANAIAPMDGPSALSHISDLLRLDVRVRGLERVPATGPVMVVANHPTGIADGIAVHDALKQVRDDLVFFANADAMRVNPRFADCLIPVEWVEAKRTRDKTRAMLATARAAFETGACVVMFPAGRLARRDRQGRLSDPSWSATSVSLAQRYEAPLIPIHLSGPESVWFQTFHRFSQELRDITLFHEFLNKAGGRFDLTIGPAIDPHHPGLSAAALQAHVERRLADDPDAVFAP